MVEGLGAWQWPGPLWTSKRTYAMFNEPAVSLTGVDISCGNAGAGCSAPDDGTHSCRAKWHNEHVLRTVKSALNIELQGSEKNSQLQAGEAGKCFVENITSTLSWIYRWKKEDSRKRDPFTGKGTDMTTRSRGRNVHATARLLWVSESSTVSWAC